MNPDFKVDYWLTKRFKAGREGYNCWAFCREAWEQLTGQDLGNLTPEGARDPKAYQEAAAGQSQSMVKLNNPVSPCLVLFTRAGQEPHIGVYFQGRVLHLTQRGAYYMPLDFVSRGFTSVSFYK